MRNHHRKNFFWTCCQLSPMAHRLAPRLPPVANPSDGLTCCTRGWLLHPSAAPPAARRAPPRLPCRAVCHSSWPSPTSGFFMRLRREGSAAMHAGDCCRPLLHGPTNPNRARRAPPPPRAHYGLSEPARMQKRCASLPPIYSGTPSAALAPALTLPSARLPRPRSRAALLRPAPRPPRARQRCRPARCHVFFYFASGVGRPTGRPPTPRREPNGLAMVRVWRRPVSTNRVPKARHGPCILSEPSRPPSKMSAQNDPTKYPPAFRSEPSRPPRTK